MESVGTFKNTSGKLIVTDPSCDKSMLNNPIKFLGILEVKKGEWNCSFLKNTFEGWGERVVNVVCTHMDYYDANNIDSISSSDSQNSWIKEEFFLGVETGKVCVMEEYLYPGKNQVFYETICELSRGFHIIMLDNEKKGKIGFLTDSGFGDGYYNIFVRKDNDGLVTSFKIEFINDEIKEILGII